MQKKGGLRLRFKEANTREGKGKGLKNINMKEVAGLERPSSDMKLKKASMHAIHPEETVECMLSPKYDDHVGVYSRSPSPEKEVEKVASKSAQDLEWLVDNSMETVNILEYASHGTIDLGLDVPELIEEPD